MSWLKRLVGSTDAVADARARAGQDEAPVDATPAAVSQGAKPVHQLVPGWTSPEVTQTENEVILKMSAPGLDADSLQTEVDGSALVLKATGTAESGAKVNLNERLVLQGGADLSQADVAYEDGSLVVRIPKSAFPKPSN